MLSSIGAASYLDGGPPGNTGCCRPSRHCAVSSVASMAKPLDLESREGLVLGSETHPVHAFMYSRKRFALALPQNECTEPFNY